MRDGQEVKSLGSYPRDRWFKSSSPQLVGLTTIACGDARKGVNLYTTPPFMVNSSNRTYHCLKRTDFRNGKQISPFLEIVMGNWGDKHTLGRPLKSVFLTANQIAHANNEVMMMNPRDVQSKSLSGKGDIHLYKRIRIS